MGISLNMTLGYDGCPVDMDTTKKGQARSFAETDASLAARARTGDLGAFEELVRRYRNDVFALALYFVHNREEAWDLSQEVFIKAHRALRHFRGDAAFKTWLLRITANQCKDYFKKRRLATLPFTGSMEAQLTVATAAQPEQALEAKELGEAIQRAVDELPIKHRTAFLLREFEGLSYEQMACVMHCNIGTVMSRLHHARKRLQEALIRMGIVEGNHHE
jgi:RNA polymerase sigma-70 factor, ECF subfamily